MAQAQPFNEFFKAFGDFKMPTDFKMPSVDFNDLFTSQRRNIEAISSASQAMTEGAQAISRRHAEVVRSNVEQCLKASKELMTSGSPEASAAKQADFARDMFENMLSNLREVSEMATKSCFEAFDVINRRVAESMEEVGKAATQAAPKKKSSNG